MKHRVVWPIAGVLGLAVLVVGITKLSAQRPPINLPGLAPPVGRFVVAHATAARVIILDSATGQVYVAEEKDFKPVSALPKVGEGFRPPGLDRLRDRGRPREKDKDKIEDKAKDKGKE